MRKLAGFIVAATMLHNSASIAMERADIYKTSGCGCCLGWVKHLEKAGFQTQSRDVAMGILMKMKLDAGLKPAQTSCHSALIGGYFIEGHVPAAAIAKLMTERPDAVGLTVPGMPIGSPGMEAGDRKESFDVLLFRRDGSTEVFFRSGT